MLVHVINNQIDRNDLDGLRNQPMYDCKKRAEESG